MDKKFNLVKKAFEQKQKMLDGDSNIDLIRAYQRLYNTEDGRVVLNNILSSCNYGGMVVADSTEQTYFNLGIQNVGIAIADALNADLTKIEEHEKNGS